MQGKKRSLCPNVHYFVQTRGGAQKSLYVHFNPLFGRKSSYVSPGSIVVGVKERDTLSFEEGMLILDGG